MFPAFSLKIGGQSTKEQTHSQPTPSLSPFPDSSCIHEVFQLLFCFWLWCGTCPRDLFAIQGNVSRAPEPMLCVQSPARLHLQILSLPLPPLRALPAAAEAFTEHPLLLSEPTSCTGTHIASTNDLLAIWGSCRHPGPDPIASGSCGTCLGADSTTSEDQLPALDALPLQCLLFVLN